MTGIEIIIIVTIILYDIELQCMLGKSIQIYVIIKSAD